MIVQEKMKFPSVERTTKTEEHKILTSTIFYILPKIIQIPQFEDLISELKLESIGLSQHNQIFQPNKHDKKVNAFNPKVLEKSKYKIFLLDNQIFYFNSNLFISRISRYAFEDTFEEIIFIKNEVLFHELNLKKSDYEIKKISLPLTEIFGGYKMIVFNIKLNPKIKSFPVNNIYRFEELKTLVKVVHYEEVN
jgi:hypothetical protein